MTATRPEQPTPDYVPGHGLLRDKVVVVTAAAGAGITRLAAFVAEPYLRDVPHADRRATGVCAERDVLDVRE